MHFASRRTGNHERSRLPPVRGDRDGLRSPAPQELQENQGPAPALVRALLPGPGDRELARVRRPGPGPGSGPRMGAFIDRIDGGLVLLIWVDMGSPVTDLTVGYRASLTLGRGGKACESTIERCSGDGIRGGRTVLCPLLEEHARPPVWTLRGLFFHHVHQS